MAGSPRVSVILLSYNHEKYIERSINSILSQTYDDLEVVIVDDCSTDSSWEIIQKYSEQDSRVKPYRNAKNQYCGVIESAMPRARGELIAIAHSDDAWAPTKLEKQVAYLDEHPDVGACFTRVCIIDDDDAPLADDPSYAGHPYLSVFEQPNRSRTDWLRSFFFNGNALCHPSAVIRRHCYLDYGLFPHALGSFPDFQEWIRLCRHSSLYILDEQLTYFRVHRDESNSSGRNAGPILRENTEKFLLLSEYLLLTPEDFLKAFPEAEEYVVEGELVLPFALSRLCLDKVRHPAYKLFAFEQLYALLQDPVSRDQVKRLYGYTERDFDTEKKRYDIFGQISTDLICRPKLYWDAGDGFNERDAVQVDALVPSTHQIRLDAEIPGGVKALRFDPDEGQLRRIRIVNALLNNEALHLSPVNGDPCDDGDTCFFTDDPQFSAAVAVDAPAHVHITFEVHSVEMSQIISAINGRDAVIAERDAALSEAAQQVSALRGSLDATLGSRVRRLFKRP